MPTQERLRELFDYDAETGFLTSKLKRAHLPIGAKCGSVTGTGHILCGLPKRNYQLAHRIIWTLLYGPIPKGKEIDHINGIPSDNRIVNLRLVSHQTNLRNLKLRADNTSGCPGVYLSHGKWVAEIHFSDKKLHIGTYETFKQAVVARKQTEKVHNFHPNHGRVVQLKAA